LATAARPRPTRSGSKDIARMPTDQAGENELGWPNRKSPVMRPAVFHREVGTLTSGGQAEVERVAKHVEVSRPVESP